jgi:hypothetical protein
MIGRKESRGENLIEEMAEKAAFNGWHALR